MNPKFIFLPCGGTAAWDSDSDMGYRCMDCFAVVGSIGQADRCKTAAEKYREMKILGVAGGWNYRTGKEIFE